MPGPAEDVDRFAGARGGRRIAIVRHAEATLVPSRHRRHRADKVDAALVGKAGVGAIGAGAAQWRIRLQAVVAVDGSTKLASKKRRIFVQCRCCSGPRYCCRRRRGYCAGLSCATPPALYRAESDIADDPARGVDAAFDPDLAVFAIPGKVALQRAVFGVGAVEADAVDLVCMMLLRWMVLTAGDQRDVAHRRS